MVSRTSYVWYVIHTSYVQYVIRTVRGMSDVPLLYSRLGRWVFWGTSYIRTIVCMTYSNAPVAEHPISRTNLVVASMILMNSKAIVIYTLREKHKIQHFYQTLEMCTEKYHLRSYYVYNARKEYWFSTSRHKIYYKTHMIFGKSIETSTLYKTR